MGRTFFILFALALALLSLFHQAQAKKCFKKGEPIGFYEDRTIDVSDAGECSDECQRDKSCKYWLFETSTSNSRPRPSGRRQPAIPSRFPGSSRHTSRKQCRLSSYDYSDVPSDGSTLKNYMRGSRNCNPNDCLGKGEPDGFAAYTDNMQDGNNPMVCYNQCKQDPRCKYWQAEKLYPDDYVICKLSANDYSNKEVHSGYTFPTLSGSKNCKASSSDW